ncbi:hypothetical protein QBC46DRAFT_265247 [Diplogelasinospora grovesii]|uniref:Apple domain-containing protein n=1 Tax=Diplogelasinospora grovesii TaxID=303347 RepID=A0AAN6N3P6_9PEZI|nr:hypothetical protein QBC46DRAFT_265247 [Diplogelasinospora grovesii]
MTSSPPPPPPPTNNTYNINTNDDSKHDDYPADNNSKKPRWAEHDPSAGPEVLPHSNLEVVAAPRPDLSHTKTWEKHSGLPELTTAAGAGAGWYGGGGYPNSPSASSTAAAYPPTYNNNSYHHHHQAHHGLIPPPPPPPSQSHPPPEGGGGGERICGLKKQIFRAVLAIAVFLAVVGVAVGVGVGVAMHKSDPSPAANTTSPTATNGSSSSSGTLPAPTAQGTTGPEQTIQCPGNNLTLYTSGVDTQKQYVLLCGRDYNSGSGSVDLYNQPTNTVGDCMDLCAEQQGCVGAGWGSYQGQYVCWLKSKLATPNWTPGWYFFIEDDNSTKGTS